MPRIMIVANVVDSPVRTREPMELLLAFDATSFAAGAARKRLCFFLRGERTVHGFKLQPDSVDPKRFGLRGPQLPHGLCSSRVGHQANDRVPEGIHIAGGKQQPGPAVFDPVGKSTDPRGHDRLALGPSLRDHDALGFVHARKHEELAGCEEVPFLLLRNLSKHPHAIAETEIRPCAESRGGPSVRAGEPRPRVWNSGDRLNQVQHPLFPVKAA